MKIAIYRSASNILYKKAAVGNLSKKTALLHIFGRKKWNKVGLGLDPTGANGIKAFLFKFYGFTVQGLEKYEQDKSSALWEVLLDKDDD